MCIITKYTWVFVVSTSEPVGAGLARLSQEERERENDDQSRLVLSFTWSLDYEAAADLVWS